ncbi:radical SAM protein [uncultured Flavonifractor sp.]|uniref:Radical SAM protein n=1 Tax=Candidatus Flavonifractor intestinigallinarum TaxID=2838586 RepID=A0A9D2SB13_9FIRM|nr:radical SAM protein [uncultured Flavonifractor sp.]HJB80121.1 radical SAM protein [Candidatus Flavonifractor intestinigallinarum]
MSIPARLKAFGISKALDYLDRDPDANLPRLMEWLDKYAGERLSPPYQALFHQAMTDPDNNWHQLIRSMYTDIDNRILKKIFENFIIHGHLLDWPAKKEDGQLSQDQAPWSVIIDPSFPCAMDCTGCGASIFGVRPSMEFDSLDEELEARKARGCHLFIFSGGNSLARQEEIIALCNKHTDCVFAVFTPPASITPSLCEDLLRVRNLFPAIQVDVDPADAQRASLLLREHKLPFGVACRCTADNADRVATEEYYDRIIDSGAKFCWFFTCPAYGGPAAPTREQLLDLHRRVQAFRKTKPLLTLDFWDGPSPSAAPQGGF